MPAILTTTPSTNGLFVHDEWQGATANDGVVPTAGGTDSWVLRTYATLTAGQANSAANITPSSDMAVELVDAERFGSA